MFTPHWAGVVAWFYGFFPLEKLVSGLLPAGGQGRLHEYSPLGEWVGSVVTFHWVCWIFIVSS